MHARSGGCSCMVARTGTSACAAHAERMTGVSCAGCVSTAKGVAEAPVAGNASAGCTSIGLANAPPALGVCCAQGEGGRLCKAHAQALNRLPTRASSHGYRRACTRMGPGRWCMSSTLIAGHADAGGWSLVCMLAWSRGVSSTAAASWKAGVVAAAAGNATGGCAWSALPAGAPE